VSLRSPASFRLTREKGKEVDISLIHQKQRIWIDQDEGGSSSMNADDPSQETTESPDDYGNTGLFTCLHFFVYDSWNIYPFLELVLEYVKEIKSIVNAYDCHGRMPLHLAVKWGNTKAAKLLINNGADVNVPSLNQKDDRQATPLILSSRPSGVCLLTLNDLLAANADPNIADSAGRTALSWAVTNPSGKSPSNCCWREVMLTLAFQNRLIAVWQLAFQARDVLGAFEKQALEGTDSGQMGAYFQSRVNKKRQTGQNHGS